HRAARLRDRLGEADVADPDFGLGDRTEVGHPHDAGGELLHGRQVRRIDARVPQVHEVRAFADHVSGGIAAAGLGAGGTFTIEPPDLELAPEAAPGVEVHDHLRLP